jgi:uncharacterized membrane protein
MKRPTWFFLLSTCVSICATPAWADPFKCGGTEPFWDLSISDREISYESSSLASSFKLEPTAPESARGAAADYVLVYRTRIVGVRDEPVTLVLQKSLESKCSDGMSETRFPFYVVFITRRNVLTGCCMKK